ncbi:hypothetical protein KY363_00280 [Candidatus Woesearchaeota archaeon]|nr:hypothetical protein [Candidatus Woesearchaeota archaeon]
MNKNAAVVAPLRAAKATKRVVMLTADAVLTETHGAAKSVIGFRAEPSA